MSELERRVIVATASASYPIHISDDRAELGDHLAELVRDRRVVLVTDRHVAAHQLDAWRPYLKPAMDLSQHVIEPGERSKDADHWITLQEHLIQSGLGRDGLIVAVGGGVVGDLAGFAAATYMRGIEFVQIPTSLLAQVDSSVGGKTAINLSQGKNLVGAFHQPIAVLIDVHSLKTLPTNEFRAGLAETLKYGAIMDPGFFAWLEQNVDQLLSRQPDALIKAIETSCRCKADIVARDERESGVRAWLNFGHTFGHAIEAELNYQGLVHGEAVAIGMCIAAEYSVRRSGLEPDDRDRLTRLIDRFGLPTRVPEGLGAARLAQRMCADKKVLKGQVRLIVLPSLGAATIDEQGDLALAEQLFGEFGARSAA